MIVPRVLSLTKLKAFDTQAGSEVLLRRKSQLVRPRGYDLDDNMCIIEDSLNMAVFHEGLSDTGMSSETTLS